MEIEDNTPIEIRKISNAYDEAKEAIKNISLDKRDWQNAYLALERLHKWVRNYSSLQKTVTLDTYLAKYNEIRRKGNSPELKARLPNSPWNYAVELYGIYNEWLGYLIEVLETSGILRPEERKTMVDTVGYRPLRGVK